jgi:tetratricopeptide (TPR) repeat protein
MRPTGKRALFWSLTLLLPLAVLACVELLFRATGLFAPEPLVVDVPDSHGAFVKFNPWITRRYFDSTDAALPNLAPESFARQKGPSTFRILCLGESTTAGFPFESQVPFPAQLREILAHAYPHKRIEVLNAGISAISSYVVLDLLPELLQESNPDLVVAYLGHNEFYGVYGSGSTLFPAKKRALVTTMLRLQHFHFVQMLKRGLQAVRRRSVHSPGNRTLMQSVVGNQEIAFGSPEYRTTMDAFRANLEAMADLCRDRGVPMVISNLVANERDQPPFHSLVDSARGPDVAGTVGAALHSGDSLLAAGHLPASRARFLDALRADSNNADAWFGMGRARLAQGDSSEALRWFLGAKDRDAMRFRASGDANAIIVATASAKGLTLANMVSAFRGASPGEIVGREMMVDHLHPNPQGYYLMAETLYSALVSSGVLPPPDSSFTLPDTPYGVTDLDWEIGLVKIFPMLHEWPFRHEKATRAEYRSHGDTAATRIAVQYHRAGFAWARAHDMMGHLYLVRGDLERARAEYRAVAVYQPDDPWPHQQIAALYESEGNWPLRSASLQEALVRSPVKGMIAYQLAISEWKQGHLEKAITAMDFAAGAPELNRAEHQNARFYLAGFLSDNHRRDDAIRMLHTILAEDPSFMPARQFLSRLAPQRPNDHTP